MKLSIDKSGDFWEVFDWNSKTTLFVNPSKEKCINEAKLIQSGGINKWLATVKPEA